MSDNDSVDTSELPQNVDNSLDGGDQTEAKENSTLQPIQWMAHEYVHTEKGALWFVIFAIIVILFIATDVFFLKSWTFSLLVIVMAVALVMYIKRPPRELQYTLSPSQGLYVGEKMYHLGDFKSFGIIQDGEHYSIVLIPVKRFAPAVSVYFPEDAGEQIVDILASRLPMQDAKLDAIDILIRKLRL